MDLNIAPILGEQRELTLRVERGDHACLVVNAVDRLAKRSIRVKVGHIKSSDFFAVDREVILSIERDGADRAVGHDPRLRRSRGDISQLRDRVDRFSFSDR